MLLLNIFQTNQQRKQIDHEHGPEQTDQGDQGTPRTRPGTRMTGMAEGQQPGLFDGILPPKESDGSRDGDRQLGIDNRDGHEGEGSRRAH